MAQTTHLTVALLLLLAPIGLVACDSNPTPHPQGPDVTGQFAGEPDSDDKNNEEDPSVDLGPDGARDEDATNTGEHPTASADAAQGDSGLASEATDDASADSDEVSAPCPGEYEGDDDPFGAADPSDSNGDGETTTLPNRGGSPLEDDRWP